MLLWGTSLSISSKIAWQIAKLSTKLTFLVYFSVSVCITQNIPKNGMFHKLLIMYLSLGMILPLDLCLKGPIAHLLPWALVSLSNPKLLLAGMNYSCYSSHFYLFFIRCVTIYGENNSYFKIAHKIFYGHFMVIIVAYIEKLINNKNTHLCFSVFYFYLFYYFHSFFMFECYNYHF